MSNPAFMFDVGSATHRGKVRNRNEDSFLVCTQAGLWAVADGMGGHESGDVASRLVVETLETIAVPTSAIELLEECESRLFYANRQILDISRSRGGAIIGTTVAILLISENHFACVWAGDSRIYLAKTESIRQISRDHTEAEALVSDGVLTAEQTKDLPNNVITRAIGVQEDLEIELATGEFEDGDIFVICSDGLTGHVADDEILKCVSGQSPQASCNTLLDLALERGGLDNVTIVVVKPCAETKSELAAPNVLPLKDAWE
jgi:serine/threonine protein phosphatase PrpC